jgi:hypothetical protein
MKRLTINAGINLTKKDLGFLKLLGKGHFIRTSTLRADQHDRLQKIIGLFEIIYHLISACYKYFKNRKAHTGKAAIESLATALKGEFPDVSIDFSKVCILKGSLAPYCGAMYHSEHSDKLSFSWPPCTQCNSNPGDELMGMIYCPEIREFRCEPNPGITRADGFCTIDVPLEFLGREIHVWLAYRSADQQSYSDSAYMGKVLITKTR